MTLFLLSSQEPTPTTYLEDAGFKNKRLVLGSNTDTFFTNNYQSTIKAIKKHLGFDIWVLETYGLKRLGFRFHLKRKETTHYDHIQRHLSTRYSRPH